MLDRPLLMDVIAFEEDGGGADGSDGVRRGAVRVPVARPAVALVMPGPERPRYPHPSRIAVAWNEGFVEIWPAARVGCEREELAVEAEMGGLVLGAERQRGQVVSGFPAAAAEELAGLHSRQPPRPCRGKRGEVRRRSMGFDLSDLQALMGGSFEEPIGEKGACGW